MFQYLCYYQRELALWMWHNLDTRAADICLDTELAPAFKVLTLFSSREGREGMHTGLVGDFGSMCM
jgi:hypothetical protein